MNIQEQLKHIQEKRKRDHEEYLAEKNKENENKIREQNEIEEKKLVEKRVECLTNIRMKYFWKKTRSIISIQRWWRNKLYSCKCINEIEAPFIEPWFRIRIRITMAHVIPYSEENMDPDLIPEHRIIHQSQTFDMLDTLFWYLFDINDIYYKRNDVIILDDSYYYLQPLDHIAIINKYNEWANDSNDAAIRINKLEYIKSVSNDMTNSISTEYLETRNKFKLEIRNENEISN